MPKGQALSGEFKQRVVEDMRANKLAHDKRQNQFQLQSPPYAMEPLIKKL